MNEEEFRGLGAAKEGQDAHHELKGTRHVAQGQTLNDGMTMAVSGLLEALDRTPRANWRATVEMALTSVHAMGYAVGFRTANLSHEKAEEETRHKVRSPEPTPTISHTVATMYPAPQKEDRALDHAKPDPNEQLQDAGYPFILAIARWFGNTLAEANYRPEDLKFDWVQDKNEPFAYDLKITLKPTKKG